MIRATGPRLVRAMCPCLSQAASGLSQAAGRQDGSGTGAALDEVLFGFLVCPLAKTPLRYDKVQQLLINDDLGVGYPIVNGVPQLIPSQGRILGQEQKQPNGGQQSIQH